ncbi:TetR/AcrR family transcriptional regulator [Nocardia sp. NPDC059240]|uniref:TetR/AcrR family transcriptional regulator n=1 Tax=Nocardia sp. NPDC059240 TaxID=3346786 RepID=UPI00368E3DDE
MAKQGQAGGRPRDGRVDQAIAVAVRALLAEQGYGTLTVDAVAARAGVGKAAIYRRYSSKQEMIFAVILHGMGETPPTDTGSLRGDVTALAAWFGDRLVHTQAGVMVGLLADIYADPALQTRFTDTYLAVERSIVTGVIDRAMERGELPGRPDPALVHGLLLGPLFTWQIMLDENPARTPLLAQTIAHMVTDALSSGVVPPEDA